MLKREVSASVLIDENIYECDYISSPFILGIVNPHIYIPSSLVHEEKAYVLKHEKAHLMRKDHIWKPLGFLILTIYWFHPLCWIAYILFCKDIEYACDEKATVGENKQWKADYCQALLNCSTPRKMLGACPVAFSENSVKGRVKRIMNYKKPKFWIILLAIVSFIGVGICFATTNKSDSENVTKQTEEKQNIEIDYGASSIYSKEDMDEAINLIIKKFNTWEGCELHSIRYSSDKECNSENVTWLNDIEIANDNKEKYTECIMFISDFHSPKNGGSGWEADCEYTDWHWWLARSEGGKWKLITSGY